MTTMILPALLTTLLASVSPPTELSYGQPTIHRSIDPQIPTLLIATAYTDLTLPTLRRGDRGHAVKLLQQVLLDNGFLGAAGVRLGNPDGIAVDGIFGPVTESAVRDLQQRYKNPVTGVVTPATWETIDRFENLYRSPLPWKL